MAQICQLRIEYAAGMGIVKMSLMRGMRGVWETPLPIWSLRFIPLPIERSQPARHRPIHVAQKRTRSDA